MGYYRLSMSNRNDGLKHLAIFALGGALGVFLLKAPNDESKKSAAKRDDPEGVSELCVEVGKCPDD
jgi:hypothetical protein